MYYRIEIAIDNAAFSPEPGPELARILSQLAHQIECIEEADLEYVIRLRDYNGNAVGTAALSDI